MKKIFYRKAAIMLSAIMAISFGCVNVQAETASPGQTFTKAEYTKAAYISEYEKRTAASERAYPLYCGDSAIVLNGLNQLDGSVIFADPGSDLNEIIKGLKAGDMLLLHEGKYEDEIEIGSKVKGTAENHVTIAAVPGEKAVLSGENLGKGAVLMTMSGCQYVDVQDLTFCGARGNDACGILVESGTKHFTLSGNEFSDIRCDGRNSANAILLFGESPKNSIAYGKITDNYAHDCATGWGEAISITGNVYKVDSSYNTVENTGNIGIDYSGNYGYCSKASVDFPRQCVVEYNEVRNCISSYATSYGIYVDGGQNITLRNNTVRGCSGGIEVGAEEKPKAYKYSTRYIKVLNNTIEDNIENGITVGGYKKTLGWVRNVTISGNTCNNNGYDSLTLSKCDHVKITGNRFYNSSSDSNAVYSAIGKKYTRYISFSNNKYGTEGCHFKYRGKTYKTFKAWKKATKDKGSQIVK